jgi:hypothetical protein
MAIVFQLQAQGGGPPVLPDDCRGQRLAGGAVPEDYCFPLVRQSDRGNSLHPDASSGLAQAR